MVFLRISPSIKSFCFWIFFLRRSFCLSVSFTFSVSLPASESDTSEGVPISSGVFSTSIPLPPFEGSLEPPEGAEPFIELDKSSNSSSVISLASSEPLPFPPSPFSVCCWLSSFPSPSPSSDVGKLLIMIWNTFRAIWNASDEFFNLLILPNPITL